MLRILTRSEELSSDISFLCIDRKQGCPARTHRKSLGTAFIGSKGLKAEHQFDFLRLCFSLLGFPESFSLLMQ